ncbi:MAG: cadherin repeat domain-containing protein, partial [Thermodesulfobacteriota bacterium]
MKRLILIEVLSYGQVFRYPLDSLQNVPAQPGATYAVVESKSDEIPDDLLIRRKGDALEIMIDGKPVAEIGDFYGVDSTATYSIDGSSAPTQAMLISGADSAVINDGAVLWQAEGGGSGWGSLSPWVWWGAGGALAVGGAVALVGGSSDSGATESTTPTTSSSPADEAPPSGDSTPALDQVAPTILSPAVAQAIDENSGAGQVVYTVTSDDGAATYSLGSSYDSAAFSIDLNSGEVRLSVNPDYESQPSFHFTVLATDPAGNSSAPQAVSLAINDLDDDPGPPPAEDETPPTITSGATAPAIDENSGAGQVVYTVTSDDASASYSLRPGQSRQNFSIDPESGEVTLAANPDYEEQESYSF